MPHQKFQRPEGQSIQSAKRDQKKTKNKKNCQQRILQLVRVLSRVRQKLRHSQQFVTVRPVLEDNGQESLAGRNQGTLDSKLKP